MGDLQLCQWLCKVEYIKIETKKFIKYNLRRIYGVSM